MVKHDTDKNNVVNTNEKVLVTNSPSVPSKLPFYLSIILCLLALLLSSFALYSYFIFQQQKTAEINQLKSELSNNQQQQNSLDAQLDVATKALNQSQNNLQEKVQNALSQFHENLEKVVQQSQYKEQDWLLLQARYYLELAQMNAQWNNNSSTTLALLKQADSVLSDINEQRLFPVRQAIAKEISQVEAIPKIDAPGLLSQLDACQDLIQTIPLKKPGNIPNEDKQTETTPANTPKWKMQWNKSLEVLNKLVVIRRNNDVYQPLIAPKEEGLARTLLRLNLQEAQWAVLQLNNDVYQFTLKQALKNVEQTFDTTNTKTQALLSKIKSLQEIKLTQPKVNLNQSLPLLNNLLGSMEKSS